MDVVLAGLCCMSAAFLLSTSLNHVSIMPNVTIATEPADLLTLCNEVCEKLGKRIVASRLSISIQALNRALEENPDPYYRLQRRLQIVGLCFEVKAGPFSQFQWMSSWHSSSKNSRLNHE